MTSEEIKERTNMSDVISGIYHIPIVRNMCRCPFHDDKKPSMRVYEDSAYCFTCSKQWDIFSFIQDMDGVGFKEAFISLGGTYKRANSKAEAWAIRKKHDIRKAELERKQRERKRQFKEITDAMLICECGTEAYEPLSDEWCYYVNALTYIQYVYEAIYIDGSEGYDLNVHRKCNEIRARCFS